MSTTLSHAIMSGPMSANMPPQMAIVVGSKRGPWNAAEDQVLMSQINTHGPQNWVRIAGGMYGRTAKQCRERFHQKLKNGLRQEAISPEEGDFILKKVTEIGKKWAQIARMMGNRSDNQVKNWWNGHQNRRRRSTTDRRSNRAVRPSTSPRPAPAQLPLPPFQGPPPVASEHSYRPHWDNTVRAPAEISQSWSEARHTSPTDEIRRMHISSIKAPASSLSESVSRSRPPTLDLRSLGSRPLYGNGRDPLPSPSQILHGEHDAPPSLVSDPYARSPLDRSPETPGIPCYQTIQLPTPMTSTYSTGSWSTGDNHSKPSLLPPITTPEISHHRNYSSNSTMGFNMPYTPQLIDPDLRPMSEKGRSQDYHQYGSSYTSSYFPPTEQHRRGDETARQQQYAQVTSPTHSHRSHHSQDSSSSNRRAMDINDIISH